jgi:RNA polymerase sigma-70 factor (ECF subfamily)
MPVRANDEADELLMEQVCAGVRRPMATLLQRWARPMWVFLLAMLGDPRRAEMLFLDVFLAVWIHRKGYEYPRPFRVWLFEMAVKKCLHRLRDHRRKGESLPQSSGKSPAGRGVLRLPPRQRAVAVLRIANEFSYEQIAEITGHPEAIVRAEMTQALARLRRHWESHGRWKARAQERH